MTPLLVLATPSPTPSPGGTLDPNSVSPGLTGFLVTFGLAVAVWFLARNLVGRLRRLNHRPDGEGEMPGSRPQVEFPPIVSDRPEGPGRDDAADRGEGDAEESSGPR